MAEDRARRIAVGCDDFATKPIDRKVLLDVVYQNLHRDPPSDSAHP
jgi:CheY-like chemotaxis protein